MLPPAHGDLHSYSFTQCEVVRWIRSHHDVGWEQRIHRRRPATVQEIAKEASLGCERIQPARGAGAGFIIVLRASVRHSLLDAAEDVPISQMAQSKKGPQRE